MADNQYMAHGRQTEKNALMSLYKAIKPKKIFKAGLTINPLVPFVVATTGDFRSDILLQSSLN